MKKIKRLLAVGCFLIIPVLFAPTANAAISVAELQAQINALLSQIQVLQQQLAAAQGTSWCHTFNANLRSGESGSEVQALQTALLKEGLLTDTSQSVFSGSMVSAVIAFQEKYASEVLASYGLTRGTGYVGPTTRAKLNKLYGCGAVATGNNPPVISNVSGELTLDVNQPGTWTINATDPEGGPLTYFVIWGDERNKASIEQTVNDGTAVFLQSPVFTHTYSSARPYDPKFYVKDNYGSVAQASINVKVGDTSIPYIEVLYPNNDETFEEGQTITINWETNATGIDHTIVYIERYLGKTFFDKTAQIGYLSSSQNHYDWTVNMNLPWTTGYASSNNVLASITSSYNPQLASVEVSYKIYVVIYYKTDTMSYYQDISDRSNDYFSVNLCTCAYGCENGTCRQTKPLTITSPNGGEIFRPRQIRTITWDGSSYEPSATVQLWLRDGRSFSAEWLIATTANTGSYIWTIPSQMEGATLFGYYFTIKATIDNKETDYSNDYFSIISQ